jgi:hypothetical protein
MTQYGTTIKPPYQPQFSLGWASLPSVQSNGAQGSRAMQNAASNGERERSAPRQQPVRLEAFFSPEKRAQDPKPMSYSADPIPRQPVALATPEYTRKQARDVSKVSSVQLEFALARSPAT